jgi:hypothetical protein
LHLSRVNLTWHANDSLVVPLLPRNARTWRIVRSASVKAHLLSAYLEESSWQDHKVAHPVQLVFLGRCVPCSGFPPFWGDAHGTMSWHSRGAFLSDIRNACRCLDRITYRRCAAAPAARQFGDVNTLEWNVRGLARAGEPFRANHKRCRCC